MVHGLATMLTPQRERRPVAIVDDLVVPFAEETPDVKVLMEQWDTTAAELERLAAARDGALPLSSVKLAAPYIPGQIFCTGANYRKHVIGLIMGDPDMRTGNDEAETEEERRARAEALMDRRAQSQLPYCFPKLPSCVVGPYDEVVLPKNVTKPDWELELGVVIGKRARHIPVSDAMEYVAGYAVVNDLTAREHVFRRDGSTVTTDWLSGKCFPTFLPFGPMIVPKAFVPDPYSLTIRLSVNGKVYQNERTSDMLIGIDRQIAYLSERVTLMPGDLICTGSPYGNGSAFGVFLRPGDVMEGEVSGLGMQRNRCVAEI